MRDLNHDFKNLCQRNRDGSLATQHDRESILSLIANQLDEDGFRHLRAPGVRAKHVEHLVERWHAEEIAPGTFKNRMSALRWLAEKIDKQNIVARESSAYGIAERRYVSNVPRPTSSTRRSWRPSQTASRPCRCGCKRRSGCGAKRASSCARPGPTGARCCT
jgi:hypothetical protein